MRELVETAELVAFTKVVEARSLSRAAAELRIPRATLSRRLARLEERLATRLLRRSTRSLTLTDEGGVFYRQASMALEAVLSAERSVRGSDDLMRGDLRVSVPPMMSTSFNAMLCAFAARHPDLRVHVHTTSLIVDVLHGGYDVALRASSEIQPGLIARTLFRDPMIAVASRGYLEKRGVPRTQRDIRHHRCLLGFARGELSTLHWPLIAGGQLQIEGTFFSNEIALLRDAAVDGLGIALLPRTFVLPLLTSGVLEHVLEGVIGSEMQVALVYADRAFQSPQVRAFVEAVAAWATAELAERAT
ncbi:LysR family transcriptional regulator [Sphingomonas carotinifaciens]|uniref:DNA-binding transcriptional regulator, LysR family n=1 Tax=Sphingomonas carotinifaciens TaxID=1166323 RepID=A0A1G7M0G3_9SPHN|nr:LysR family transcriptional regulator [Sphingomonas carotinifaciens]MBB4086969.1 DNA-binding transcriptional LysR family regulator [Sphingomonas carotinifaciens]MWC42163.1 LysR family transcriptional regulator [Sphingomonas carotinifaciens]SDF55151.1 DNA-binding transcriptional regulator, LysR family [Sphingomonas carotinifaciens]